MKETITKTIRLHNPYALQYNGSASEVTIPAAAGNLRGRTVEFWMYGTEDTWDNDDTVLNWRTTKFDTGEVFGGFANGTSGELKHYYGYNEEYVSFDKGSSEKMTIPNWNPGSNSFTVEMLLRLPTIPSEEIDGVVSIGSAGYNTTNSFSVVSWVGSERIYARIKDAGGTSVVSSIGSDTDGPQDGAWHFISIVVDRGNNLLKTYFDGVESDSDDISGVGAISNTGDWNLAYDPARGYEDIEIAEFRLWSDVRTPTEINDNKFAILTGAEANLERYYVFEDGAGATVTDEAGANDATLVNTPTWGTLTGTHTYDMSTGGYDYLDIEGWHHWAFTYDPDTGTSKIYLDSALIDTNTGDYSFIRKPSSFLIDNDMSDSKISEFRMWNDVRTQAEIEDNMFLELAGTESGLVLYYKFDERTGATLNDSTANEYDGTIASASWVAGCPNAGAGWVDISADVLGSRRFDHYRGISGSGPTSLVAGAGRWELYMNNSAYNSASKAGYYSPDNANIRDGFKKGAAVRVEYAYDGTTKYGWRGRIYDIYPDPSTFTPFTRVVCYDWMKEAQEQKFGKIAVTTNQRGDQVVETLLDSLNVTRRPACRNLDTGKGTFPTVFDTERDEKTAIMNMFQKTCQSELGRIYVNGEVCGEQLVFENRHHGVDETTIQLDFDDDISKISLGYPSDNVYTKILCFLRPRETDTGDVVLAQVQKSFAVPAGEYRDIQLFFRDPTGGERISASSLAARESGTDYVANASEDGSGADRTADLTVTELTELTSGNSITLRCANSGATSFWVTTLQQKGKGIYLFDRLSAEEDAGVDYTDLYGERELNFDMPYEDDYSEAANFADYLISVWKDPFCQVSGLTYYPEKSAELAAAFVAIDLGKRITVNIPHIGIDQDYFVYKETVSIDKGVIKCTYGLQPAGSATALQLDDDIYGELDSIYAKLAL